MSTMRLSEPLPDDWPEDKRDTFQLLRDHALIVTGYVKGGIQDDCILYLGPTRQPMTAWLHFGGGELLIETESGFQAERTDRAVARPKREPA